MTFTPAEEGGHGAFSFSRLPIMKEVNYYFAYHDAVKPLGGMFLVPRVFLRSIETYKIEFRAKSMNDEQALLIDLVQEMQKGMLKSHIELVNAYAERYKRIPIKYENTLKAATTAYLNLQAVPKRMDGQFQIIINDFNQKKYPKFPVTFSLTIRADNNDLTDYLIKKTIIIIKNAAKSFDVHVRIKRDTEWCYPAWEKNDPELVKIAEDSWKEMYGDTIVKTPFGEMGTDDNVYMMNDITKNGGKCIYAILASDTHSGQPTQYGELHTNKMNVDDELMIGGVNLTIKIVEKILNQLSSSSESSSSSSSSPEST